MGGTKKAKAEKRDAEVRRRTFWLVMTDIHDTQVCDTRYDAETWIENNYDIGQGVEVVQVQEMATYQVEVVAEPRIDWTPQPPADA